MYKIILKLDAAGKSKTFSFKIYLEAVSIYVLTWHQDPPHMCQMRWEPRTLQTASLSAGLLEDRQPWRQKPWGSLEAMEKAAFSSPHTSRRAALHGCPWYLESDGICTCGCTPVTMWHTHAHLHWVRYAGKERKRERQTHEEVTKLRICVLDIYPGDSYISKDIILSDSRSKCQHFRCESLSHIRLCLGGSQSNPPPQEMRLSLGFPFSDSSSTEADLRNTSWKLVFIFPSSQKPGYPLCTCDTRSHVLRGTISLQPPRAWWAGRADGPQ